MILVISNGQLWAINGGSRVVLSQYKNVVNILIKNALDCFCGAVIYWAVGYAFAYGTLDNDPNGVNKVG